jgi:flagellar biosynthetic protein FlhB
VSEHSGDKTEQATPKRLEQAHNKGQFARSREVQTAFVLLAALTALTFSGAEMWRLMANAQVAVLSHLHDIPLTATAMQGYAVQGALVLGACVWPVVVATLLAGLLAGGIQTRFQTSPEALELNWERMNPVEGFRRVFSMRSAVPTAINIAKIIVIISLTYGVVSSILTDPIFHSSVDVARIAGFMADSSFRLITRVAMALVVLAAADYGYQYWRTNEDMKMTKEEVKDETKNNEGNPQVKAQRRRKQFANAKRRMLAEVPKADVVVVNPTHIAVALRYDKKTMKAPKIVAKGSRLNALRIREIATEHQVPIVENVPVARLMFKYGRVGGEIPAELYAAVAEILAWVYRVNAYRYYRERSMIGTE